MCIDTPRMYFFIFLLSKSRNRWPSHSNERGYRRVYPVNATTRNNSFVIQLLSAHWKPPYRQLRYLGNSRKRSVYLRYLTGAKKCLIFLIRR